MKRLTLLLIVAFLGLPLTAAQAKDAGHPGVVLTKAGVQKIRA